MLDALHHGVNEAAALPLLPGTHRGHDVLPSVTFLPESV